MNIEPFPRPLPIGTLCPVVGGVFVISPLRPKKRHSLTAYVNDASSTCPNVITSISCPIPAAVIVMPIACCTGYFYHF